MKGIKGISGKSTTSIEAMFFTAEDADGRRGRLNSGRRHGSRKRGNFHHPSTRFTFSGQAEKIGERLKSGEDTVTIKAMFFTTACHGVARLSEDGRKMRTLRKPLRSEI